MGEPPDLAEFYKLSRPRRKPCTVAAAVGLLSKPEQEQFEAAMALAPTPITFKAISVWLEERGHDVNTASLGSHKRRACSCGRDE